MANVGDIDVDNIWTALGRLGSYQRRQIIVMLVAIWSCGFHILSIVFLGYRPAYECKEPYNTSHTRLFPNTTIVYEKCSIKYISNDTGTISITETDCINGWTYHYAGPFQADRSFFSEWDLVCDRNGLAELSQTLFMIGQGIGAFVFTSLSDRYGRKSIHILSHVAVFVIALVTAFVPNFTSFAIMRMLLGAFQQGTGLTNSMLLIEMVPKESRGKIEVCGLLFWTTGIAIVTPIAFIFRNLSWRYLQISLACLSAWSLAEWWMVDESLRWLIANGRIKEAKRIIHKACKQNKKEYNDVVTVSGFRDFEMKFASNMEKEISGSNNQSLTDMNPNTSKNENSRNEMAVRPYTVIDLVKSKRLLITSLIMWFAWTTNNITYYGIMLISSSLAGDRFLNFFLGSVVEYPAAAVELYLLNRNVGVGMASAAGRIGGMVAPFSRNLAEVNAWAPGLIFAIMCIIVAITMFWVPETHQYELPQTLEECEKRYKDNRFKLPCNRKRLALKTEARTESD